MWELTEYKTYTPFYEGNIGDLIAKERAGFAPNARVLVQQFLSSLGSNNPHYDLTDTDQSSLASLLQLELAGLNALGEGQLIQAMQQLACNDQLLESVQRLSAHTDLAPTSLLGLLKLELSGFNGLGEARLIQIVQQLGIGGPVSEGVLNLSSQHVKLR